MRGSVTNRLTKKPRTLSDLAPFKSRLANARNNRPRHIQRRHLASGWTLPKATRKSLSNYRRAVKKLGAAA